MLHIYHFDKSVFNREMELTINEIRRLNMLILLAESGGKKKTMAEKIDSSASYISQILTKNTSNRRELGDDLARRMEECYSKPRGWMDQFHAKVDDFIEGEVIRRALQSDKSVMEHSNSAVTDSVSISSTMGNYAVTPIKEIPLLTLNQAKQWKETFRSGEFIRMPYQKQEKVEITENMFYVDVTNDANFPDIKHGEIALIDPERTPENKNFVLAEINGDISIRQYIREAGDIWLIAKNSSFPPKPFDSALIIGVVVMSHEQPNIKYHV